MYLDELCEEVAELINSSPEKWGGDGTVEARVVIDWVGALKSKDLQILIVPELVQYNLEQSTGRNQPVGIHTTKFLTLMVGKGFDSLPDSDDVTPWDESSILIRIRERIELFLLSNPFPNMKIESIEGQGVDEQELDHRNFNAFTSIGYGMIQCGSEHAL